MFGQVVVLALYYLNLVLNTKIVLLHLDDICLADSARKKQELSEIWVEQIEIMGIDMNTEKYMLLIIITRKTEMGKQNIV